MTTLLDAPPHPDVMQHVTLADEVDTWLRRQPRAESPVQWRPRGGEPVSVQGIEHLLAIVAGLGALGEWGVADRPVAERWGQVMRVRDGWIVEVNGLPGPDCFARRVRRIEEVDSLGGEVHCVSPSGTSLPPYRSGEAFASADAAARVLWSWLRSGLPAGFELRDLEE